MKVRVAPARGIGFRFSVGAGFKPAPMQHLRETPQFSARATLVLLREFQVIPVRMGFDDRTGLELA